VVGFYGRRLLTDSHRVSVLKSGTVLLSRGLTFGNHRLTLYRGLLCCCYVDKTMLTIITIYLPDLSIRGMRNSPDVEKSCRGAGGERGFAEVKT